MNCISKTDIQRYIDNECTPKEKLEVEQHLQQCISCRELFESQKRLIRQIKESLQSLNESQVNIPDFQLPAKTINIKRIRKIAYVVAAACLVLFVLILKKEDAKSTNEQIIITSNFEFDSNKPITEQPMVVHFVDADGNQTEIYLN